MKSSKRIRYHDILDIHKINDVYHMIRVNTHHKEKLLQFELFLTSNFTHILNILEDKSYCHGKYNIFLVTKPKFRIIMSESMSDKIINHLLSKYVLFPLIDFRLIPTNVATRVGKGSFEAITYMKRYINSLKVNCDKIYALKCDVTKYFYSIDHEILKSKLRKIIRDEDLFLLISSIIDSTDRDYVNGEIERQIGIYKKSVVESNISEREKRLIFESLDRLPRYKSGKGLPIGNMTSQIMAIFYLNDLDHFIKETLHVKYYIRYMDDLVLLHPDKNYLRYCLSVITDRLALEKLVFNDKTQIYEVHKGIPFIGYKFTLKGKRLIVTMCSNTKRCIIKKINRCGDFEGRKDVLDRYNGYLGYIDSGKFKYDYLYGLNGKGNE